MKRYTLLTADMDGTAAATDPAANVAERAAACTAAQKGQGI